jgi:hypothetical protein
MSGTNVKINVSIMSIYRSGSRCFDKMDGYARAFGSFEKNLDLDNMNARKIKIHPMG